jgi:hypothetical protein
LTPTDRAVLVKGSKTQVTGHVAASNPAGMTVEAVMGDQVFGAGFTDGNGDFSFPLNITAAQSVNMAQPLPGAVLRGQTEGWVNWTANPSRVPPSTGIGLTIRTYATANTPPFTTPPRSLPALASASRSLSMVVHATSLLSLSTASKQVLAEQPFRIDFRLTDSGGSPLPEDTLAFAGATPQSVQGPDATGVGQAVFVLHANQGSTVNITVTSRPSQRELTSNLVTGASKPLTFTIRQAATLKLDSLAATADAGTILPVTGTLTTASGPVAGANITVTLTKGGALFGSFPATTAEGTGGRFEADIPLSSNLPFGAYLVAASSAATPTAAAAPGDSKPIQVNGLPFFKDLSSDTLAAEGPAYVTGVLVESSDPTVPLPSAKVTVRLGDAVPVTRTTAADGSFNATIPGPFAHHPIVQSAIFAGDDRHAAVTTPVERPVLSSTRLILPDGILPRGAPTAVPVRLTGASGDPVAGASMDVKWGTEPSVHLLTDDSGTAVLGRPGSPNEPLGSVRVQAWFNGSADGFWAPRSGGAVWSVQTLARLNLPTGAFDAGSFIPSGLLQDAGTQAPIGHATVLLRLDAGNVTPLQTDELGHFTFLASNARDAAPSTVRIQADFPGSGVYPPAHARSTVTIRSPVTLTPQPPPAIVAGQPTPLLVLVQDARGVRISEGQVNATLDGLLIGSAPVRDGVATLVATVPASHAAGDVGLSIDYSGSPTEGAAHTQALVHLLLPVHLEVQASGVKPGTTATVRVTLTDGGRPLPFAPVLLDVEGLGGLQGTTDKDGVATFLVLQGNTTMHMAARYGGAGSLAPATATASLVPVVPETLLHAGLRIGTWVFIAAAALLVAAAVTAYFLRRHPLEPALKRARRAILGRGPYATQILLAYRVLEDSAIASEILTGPATTPRTLEAAIAPTLPPALHGSLDRLITLFEQARYGKLPIGEAERDAAVAALDDLLRQLSRMDPFWHPSSKRRPAGGAA